MNYLEKSSQKYQKEITMKILYFHQTKFFQQKDSHIS